jgi:hypothetical protein
MPQPAVQDTEQLGEPLAAVVAASLPQEVHEALGGDVSRLPAVSDTEPLQDRLTVEGGEFMKERRGLRTPFIGLPGAPSFGPRTKPHRGKTPPLNLSVSVSVPAPLVRRAGH